jgi:hypothetical protein
VYTVHNRVHGSHKTLKPLSADHIKEAAGAYLRIAPAEVTKLKKERFFLIGGRILIRIRTKNHGSGSGYGRRTNLRILRIRIRIRIRNTVSPFLPWLFHACIQVSERTRTNTQKILKLRPRCHAMDNIPEMHSHGKVNAECRQDCLDTAPQECAWTVLSLSALVQGACGSGWADQPRSLSV